MSTSVRSERRPLTPREPALTLGEAASALQAFAEKWAGVDANERASFQTWFLQLCAALGVPAPDTPTDDYRFELPVRVVDREGELATNFIDLGDDDRYRVCRKAD